MICIRRALLLLGIVLSGSACPLSTIAQSAPAAVDIKVDLQSPQIAFSTKGRILRIIGSVQEPFATEHVRAMTYNVATGTVLHTLDLQPGTRAFSTTADGKTAIIIKGV